MHTSLQSRHWTERPVQLIPFPFLILVTARQAAVSLPSPSVILMLSRKPLAKVPFNFKLVRAGKLVYAFVLGWSHPLVPTHCNLWCSLKRSNLGECSEQQMPKRNGVWYLSLHFHCCGSPCVLQLSFLFYLPHRQRIAFKLAAFILVFLKNVTSVKDCFYIL